MVGVGAALGGDVPGLLPAEALLVHQDPHELRHRHGRVGVIQLDGNLAGKTGVKHAMLRYWALSHTLSGIR